MRFQMSRDNLQLYDVDLDNFVGRFVSMDGTWAQHFEPESKQQSKQWKHVGSPPAKEGQSCVIRWKGHCLYLLGYLGHANGELPSEGTDHQQTYYAFLFATA